MRYLREWTLPDPSQNVVEAVDRIEGYGQSYFWYCKTCSQRYASMELLPSDRTTRIWVGLSGVCPACPSNRWDLAGSIDTARFAGEILPHSVLLYQLSCELAFLDHSDHPHNKETIP